MSRLDRSTLALVFALVLLPIGALAGFKAWYDRQSCGCEGCTNGWCGR
jgi:hypothetical protein